MTGIGKAFGAVEANRDASLEVGRGEIHALVGENGAGKSTLMRVLAGLYAPNEGTVEVRGRDVTGWSTSDAIRAGVGMVHQHFMLIPTLTVAENLTLGSEPVRGLQLDRAASERATRELSERTGLRVDPKRQVSELSVGELQRVEILKALYRGAEVLILDEPTAVLSPPEVQELWTVLRRLRDAGGTIILITHKLDEVMAISEKVTVMQQGRTVAWLRTAETTPREIARAMVGRDVALALDATAPAPKVTASSEPASSNLPLLSVRDLTVSTALRNRCVDGVSLDIAPGEILGIAGVEGNGQTELVEAIAGLRPATAGSITLRGSDASQHDLRRLDVRQRGDAGLSYIPEDRHRRGLILEYTVADNLILGRQHHFSSGAQLDRARIGRNAQEQIRAFDIRPADAALPARALSGGNQQKVVIAREMGREFQVLLASQPTRGVDVGAIEFIHQQLREARAAGKAILLVSADLAEILALSDRVAVMYGGRIVTVMPRSEASAEQLGPYMTGVGSSSVDATPDRPRPTSP
ncbi:MAG: ABC transporter ATP-binding protein [Gemmatimonadaceae bacterium]|nr:ABC transporter ATP-binding protein [Gemmatimonadaceae bacterium]